MFWRKHFSRYFSPPTSSYHLFGRHLIIPAGWKSIFISNNYSFVCRKFYFREFWAYGDRAADGLIHVSCSQSIPSSDSALATTSILLIGLTTLRIHSLPYDTLYAIPAWLACWQRRWLKGNIDIAIKSIRHYPCAITYRAHFRFALWHRPVQWIRLFHFGFEFVEHNGLSRIVIFFSMIWISSDPCINGKRRYLVPPVLPFSYSNLTTKIVILDALIRIFLFLDLSLKLGLGLSQSSNLFFILGKRKLLIHIL